MFYVRPFYTVKSNVHVNRDYNRVFQLQNQLLKSLSQKLIERSISDRNNLEERSEAISGQYSPFFSII